MAALLVFFPSGWTINRLNVQIWWFLLQNTPMTAAVTPEHLAEVWNVVMFVPLGLGLALILPRWWWALVLIAVSVSIETVQYFFYSTRHADFIDVIMNSAGGFAGVLAGLAITHWCENRSAGSIDSHHA